MQPPSSSLSDSSKHDRPLSSVRSKSSSPSGPSSSSVDGPTMTQSTSAAPDHLAPAPSTNHLRSVYTQPYKSTSTSLHIHTASSRRQLRRAASCPRRRLRLVPRPCELRCARCGRGRLWRWWGTHSRTAGKQPQSCPSATFPWPFSTRWRTNHRWEGDIKPCWLVGPCYLIPCHSYRIYIKDGGQGW